MSFDNEQGVFHVVKNSEEQYSIWPEHKTMPPGWDHAGKTGNKADCLAFIEQHWIDMRPRTLREQMASTGAAQSGNPQSA